MPHAQPMLAPPQAPPATHVPPMLAPPQAPPATPSGMILNHIARMRLRGE